MIMNRKSQITVFIIIGVILLFSTALVIYIKGQVAESEREVKVAVERVPTLAQPVQQYVTECMEQVAIDAFDLIGAHGGYISVDDIDYSGIDFEKDDQKPTEADVIEYPPHSNNYVPYWEFMKAPDDCEVCYLGSYRPPLYRTEGGNSIESQVDRYIENSLRGCLRNFRELRDEGYDIEEAGPIDVTTFVREKDVLISMNYSLIISKGNEENIRISRYQSSIPINFKKVYEMAQYIIDVSAESRFLGLSTLNLISGFSRVEDGALPPFNALMFTYESVKWSKREVKTLITQMLEAYVPVIQVEGTENFNSPAGFQDPIMQGLYGGMVLPGQELSSLNVNFMYLSWPIYLDFAGSNSDSLGPAMLEVPFINLLPFRDYSFVYHLSYPVVVRISDPTAYNGEGYNFAFAMEANIRNNDAVSDESITLPAVTMETESVSEFCSESHRNSAPITVRTFDAVSGTALEGVNVIFRSSQRCSMGVTEINDDVTSADFGYSMIEEKFPVGIGTIILSKPGYATVYKKFATSLEDEKTVSFELYPVKRVPATVMKKKIQGNDFFPTTGILGPAQNLSEKDIVIISMEKVKEVPEEEPIVSALAFGESINSTLSNITLVPGTYKVTASYIYNGTVTIPEDEICEGGVLGIGEECVDVPELEFKSYVFPSLEYEWEVSDSDFEDVNEVEFYMLYADLPEEHEDMEEITKKFSVFKNELNYIHYEPEIK